MASLAILFFWGTVCLAEDATMLLQRGSQMPAQRQTNNLGHQTFESGQRDARDLNVAHEHKRKERIFRQETERLEQEQSDKGWSSPKNWASLVAKRVNFQNNAPSCSKYPHLCVSRPNSYGPKHERGLDCMSKKAEFFGEAEHGLSTIEMLKMQRQIAKVKDNRCEPNPKGLCNSWNLFNDWTRSEIIAHHCFAPEVDYPAFSKLYQEHLEFTGDLPMWQSMCFMQGACGDKMGITEETTWKDLGGAGAGICGQLYRHEEWCTSFYVYQPNRWREMRRLRKHRHAFERADTPEFLSRMMCAQGWLHCHVDWCQRNVCNDPKLVAKALELGINKTWVPAEDKRLRTVYSGEEGALGRQPGLAEVVKREVVRQSPDDDIYVDPGSPNDQEVITWDAGKPDVSGSETESEGGDQGEDPIERDHVAKKIKEMEREERLARRANEGQANNQGEEDDKPDDKPASASQEAIPAEEIEAKRQRAIEDQGTDVPDPDLES